MNDHLARFFQHADSLLQEWQAYGDKLQGSIDAQVNQLNQTVASAVTEAGKTAVHKIDAQLEQSMAESLASVRREIDSIARLANQTAARMQGTSPAARAGATGSASAVQSGARRPGGTRPGGTNLPPARAGAGFASPIFWALITANIMLAVLIGMGIDSCEKAETSTGVSASRPPEVRSPIAPGSQNPGATDGAGGQNAPRAKLASDAGIAGAGHSSMRLAADQAGHVCAVLARAYDSEAAQTLITASVAATCTTAEAAAVADRLLARLATPPARTSPQPGNKSKKSKGQSNAGRKRSSGKGKSSTQKGKGSSGKSKKAGSSKNKGK